MTKRILKGDKKPEYYKGLIIRADSGLHSQVTEQLTMNLHPESKILDLGAGEGALSLRLSDLGYDVTAVDINAVEFKAPGVKFEKVDFNSSEEVVSFVNRFSEQFDAVLGLEVIEHVENPYEYVRLLKKLVKQKGLVILTTPNTGSWLSRLLFLFKGRFHQFSDGDLEYGHISPITEWELSVIFNREGFEDIRIISGGLLPAIWLKKSLKHILYNLFALALRPLMKGIKDGWCLICIARKI